MKRIIACIVALMVCASMVLPVAAAPFTPSVTYKPCPNIVPVQDPDGRPAQGVLLDDDQILEYIYNCLVITPVSEAEDSEDIPQAAKELLLDIYKKLKDGTMKLPYDKLGDDVDPNKMAIRDLFDASFLCEGITDGVDHAKQLDEDGVTLKLTMDLDVDDDEKVYAMVYVDGQWEPVVSTVNNGDGTVTCVFEDICPVVFCVENEETETPDKPQKPPVQTGDPAGDNLLLWAVLGSVCLVAVVVLVVVYRTKLSKKS